MEKPAENPPSDTTSSSSSGAASASAPPNGGPDGGSVRRPPAQAAGLWKSAILFVVIVAVLAGVAIFLGNESGGGGRAAAPKWNVGQTVDVELTLVATDAKDLGCASTEEVRGRHCSHEAQARIWSKGDTDEKNLLKPYMTVDSTPLMAAGLWSEGELKGQLPSTRFTVKCKYTVEGKMKNPAIRWRADEQFQERGHDWFTGSVSECKVSKPASPPTRTTAG